MTRLQRVLHGVLSARIILNLRKAPIARTEAREIELTSLVYLSRGVISISAGEQYISTIEAVPSDE